MQSHRRGLPTELPIAASREEARVALDETREAMALLASGTPLPIEPFPDVRPSLDRVARGGALDGVSLRDVARVLAGVRVLRRFLGKQRALAPALERAFAADPTLDELEDAIGDVVGPDGLVHDRASPVLASLRREVSDLREKLVARLDTMIEKQRDLLQDSFYTLREGRYVLPVRRDAHERVHGIVHGTSASGATIFVEPRALVALGNRLKMAQSELEQEEARVLAAISSAVGDRIPELRAAVDALEHVDLRASCARFGEATDGIVLPLADGPSIDLRRGRHPLLVIDGVAVVPNDLRLDAGHALVISGPNAGGKTVALTTMGLAALMMRAGLPVPADEGSTMGFFSAVLTDVGDAQSLVQSLSTFSGHVRNLVAILDATGDDSLVLLDELAGGTDPEEGAALACAVVDALCRKGAAVAVTTHYEPLKAFAQHDERLRNAAVGFDVATMAPTFAVLDGVPGASSALVVAQRFGMPSEIIELARRVLPEQSKTFDELVRGLESERRSLEVSRREVEVERAAATRAREALAAELARARAEEHRRVDRESERLLEAVRKARDELQATRRSLREAKEEEALREARAEIERAAAAAAEARAYVHPETGDDATAGAPATRLEIGARVFVPSLRRDAEIVEGPTRGRLRVAAGAMRLWVDASELRAPRPASAAAGAPAKRPHPTRDPGLATGDNTIDLRGMRVDDALAMLEAFLDRLYGASAGSAYVVHGVGTGALRDAVREWLGREHTYVRGFRAGSADEGGDRMTVVEIA